MCAAEGTSLFRPTFAYAPFERGVSMIGVVFWRTPNNRPVVLLLSERVGPVDEGIDRYCAFVVDRNDVLVELRHFRRWRTWREDGAGDCGIDIEFEDDSRFHVRPHPPLWVGWKYATGGFPD
jgi:hypothetical protein